jgi:hypothetical protein
VPDRIDEADRPTTHFITEKKNLLTLPQIDVTELINFPLF